MTVTSMNHFGVLVYDLEEAVDRFGDLLGLTFNEPSVIQLNRLIDPNEHSFQLRATYSREGPPHMELIEAKGHGIYAASLGEGLHHIGLWDPSVVANKAKLTDKGLLPEAQVLLPDGTAFAWYAKPDSAHGVRLEFVDSAAREDIERWIATGVASDGNIGV